MWIGRGGWFVSEIDEGINSIQYNTVSCPTCDLPVPGAPYVTAFLVYVKLLGTLIFLYLLI